MLPASRAGRERVPRIKGAAQADHWPADHLPARTNLLRLSHYLRHGLKQKMCNLSNMKKSCTYIHYFVIIYFFIKRLYTKQKR